MAVLVMDGNESNAIRITVGIWIYQYAIKRTMDCRCGAYSQAPSRERLPLRTLDCVQSVFPVTAETQAGFNNIEPYRLDFSFNELQEGKKINTRRYSMNLTAGTADEIKIGTRVPVHTGPPEPQPGMNALANTQFQYMDVGTKIWANLRPARRLRRTPGQE